METNKEQEVQKLVKETFEDLKDYLELQIRYNKIIAAKKTGEISSFSVLLIILGVIGAFFTLIASFAFVWWYSGGDDSKRYIGFLIVLAFYIVFAVVIFIFRNALLVKPLTRFITKVFFDDDELIFETETTTDDKNGKKATIIRETRLDLTDNDTYNLAKKTELSKIKAKEKELEKIVEKAKLQLNLPSLINMAAHSIREYYFNFTTMAKWTFKAFSFIKNSRRRKKLLTKKSGK
jgi:hypothetical protein